MYTRFGTLNIAGFKSFRQEQSFSLFREPGLYYVGGQNLLEPALGANGAGKTAGVPDALSWCLWGKTTRGVKGPSIKNWSAKTARVSLGLWQDNVSYTITRTQTPNSLVLESPSEKRTVSQDDIDRLLGDDYDNFIERVIVGQFSSSFLDLKPTERLNSFSSILSLDYWTQCSETASTRASAAAREIQFLSGELEQLKNKVALLTSQQADLQTRKDSFDNDRVAELATIEEGVTANRQAITLLEDQEIELDKQANQLSDLAKAEEVLITSHTSELTSLDQSSRQVSEELASTKTQLTSIRSNYDQWKALHNSCPQCTQEVSLKFVSGKKAALVKHVTQLDSVRQELLTKLASLAEQQAKIREAIAASQSKHTVIRGSMTEIATKVNGIRNEKNLKLQSIRQGRDSIKALYEKDNPYHVLLEGVKEQLVNAMSNTESSTASLEVKNRDYNGNTYWVKGFKELRMWVTADALNAFEIESNNTLSQLGLLEWNLRFAMEKENKDSTINKGFHVLIESPAHPEGSVPIEVWSGGETQRLKLASRIGKAALIQNYKGLDSNIEIWDEPSSYLSEKGIDDLIRFLAERAELTKRAIYFIDHRGLESSYFKGSILVCKNEDGSYFKEAA